MTPARARPQVFSRRNVIKGSPILSVARWNGGEQKSLSRKPLWDPHGVTVGEETIALR
jgi:hypothetical protein